MRTCKCGEPFDSKQAYCPPCNKEYQREYRLRNREEFLLQKRIKDAEYREIKKVKKIWVSPFTGHVMSV